MLLQRILISITCCGNLLFVLLLLHISKGSNAEDGPRERELRQKIFSQYNKTIPPSLEDSSTEVGVILIPTRINGLDDSGGTMTFSSYLVINWLDTRLSWKADPKYNSTIFLSLGADDIWTPTMNHYNRGRPIKYGIMGVPAFCEVDGKVWWTLAAELHPVCAPEDLRWFPTDTHTCQVSLAPSYPQNVLDLFFDNENDGVTSGIDRSGEIESPFWDVESVDYAREYISDHFGRMYKMDGFTFKIVRRSPMLVLSFLPVMLSCTAISWSSFALPASGISLTRRLSLTSMALLLQSIFMSALVKAVPGVGRRTPLIVKVYGCCVVLNFFTSLYTILLPRVLRRFSSTSNGIKNIPAALQCFLRISKSELSVEVDNLLDQEEQQIPSDGPEPLVNKTNPNLIGQQVAEACDKLHFLTQTVLLILAVVALILV